MHHAMRRAGWDVGRDQVARLMRAAGLQGVRRGRKPVTTRCPVMTTTAGAPVVDNQNSLTAGPRGPVLMQDWHLLEKLAHQNRERIPERVVHAKGWGAFGTFKIGRAHV